jgi:hypothetical protein
MVADADSHVTVVLVAYVFKIARILIGLEVGDDIII